MIILYDYDLNQLGKTLTISQITYEHFCISLIKIQKADFVIYISHKRGGLKKVLKNRYGTTY